MSLFIKPLQASDIVSAKKLTDKEIGQDYYSKVELEDMVKRSRLGERTASFILANESEIFGIRLSFPPRQWQKGKGESLSPEKWPHSFEHTAYFQSLFLAKSQRKKGWGRKLSEKSIKVLKEMGAKGIVCHSWVESPEDSSRRYLFSLGFKSLVTYPRYWEKVDYRCPRCGQPCICTAEEMYLDLESRR